MAADAYDAFMGRYSVRLAVQVADLAGATGGQRVIDVGCGTGARPFVIPARAWAVRGTA